MKRLSPFVLIAGIFAVGTAAAIDLRSQLVERNNYLSISGESSSFSLSEGAIRGSGVRMDLSHSFNRKWSMDVFLATALGNNQGVSSSFTGFGGYMFYNVLTECCDQSRVVYVNGLPVASEMQETQSVFQVGVGLNQFLLNGSRGVYSSSGPGVGANYLFRLWSYQFKGSLRTAQMISNENKVQGLFMGLGMVFPL